MELCQKQKYSLNKNLFQTLTLMKLAFSIIIFILSIFTLSARTIHVNSASAINNTTWQAGDTLVMQNGTWTNQNIALRGNGTVANPVVLMAQTQGMVVLNGSSRISFAGQYVEVNGLHFHNGTLSGADVIAFRISSSETANNSTLRNCAITNYNPPINTTDSKWVSLYGQNNRVEYCSFENKTNSGTLLVVWLTSGRVANHHIANNYFGYRNANLDSNGNEINGQEIIRIGDSSTSMTFANVEVYNNVFERCNGEIEIISNKSCGNVYRNNLFFECRGMLTLRHGNNCTVDGNYFIGNNVSNSGGVRIIGENHVVVNNYFENLRGTGFRAALCMVRGKENSALNEYFQVKNALVAFNTMVDCSQSFSINYNSTSSITLPPINSTIAHNVVHNTRSSYNNITVYPTNVASMSVEWKNNIMGLGSYSGISFNSTQIAQNVNVKMQQTNDPIPIYEPANDSELASFATAEIILVQNDIKGRQRIGSNKTPGATQLGGNVSKSMPAKSDVGAFFLQTTTSTETVNRSLSRINYKVSGNMFYFYNDSYADTLRIIKTCGTLFQNVDLVHNQCVSMYIPSGQYVLSIYTRNELSGKSKFLVF